MNRPDIKTLATRKLLVLLRAARKRESLERFFAQPSEYVCQELPLPAFNPLFSIEELKAELATREHIPKKS
jgi:hypothetical protein